MQRTCCRVEESNGDPKGGNTLNTEVLRTELSTARTEVRGDALKYWKWPPYRNCTIHEHQQKMQILTYTSNNVKYI